jgi:hypothetical protein
MVFTVVVSLLTTIMTIPLIVVLSMTLEVYISKCPGRTVDQDLITDATTEDSGDNDHSKTTVESDTVEKQYFGEVIKKGIARDRTTQSSLAKETVRFVYNGEYIWLGKIIPIITILCS